MCVEKEGRLVDVLDGQEGNVGEVVGVGKWLKISEYVGSDEAEGIIKAKEAGMPWRAVPSATYLSLVVLRSVLLGSCWK